MNGPLLKVENLKVHYPVSQKSSLFRSAIANLRAVDGVSFGIHQSEAVGVVGESGCGKSTLSRAILQLIEPTAGRVLWLGEDLGALSKPEMDRKRKDLQIIFQDPLSSLNPRMTIGNIIAEPLKAFHPELDGKSRLAAVREMMGQVGLEPELINRYPHEFSGGQCQRVGIARAMILKPKLVICDEPVSSLDVSTQATIINLLRQLQKDTGVSILFISHDLSVVRLVCTRILVMYLGQLVEIAGRDEIFNNPRHPYTRALLSAIPAPRLGSQRVRRTVLVGEVPSPMEPPSGCVFRTRCPIASRWCSKQSPPLHDVSNTHQVACHHWDDETHEIVSNRSG